MTDLKVVLLRMVLSMLSEVSDPDTAIKCTDNTADARKTFDNRKALSVACQGVATGGVVMAISITFVPPESY